MASGFFRARTENRSPRRRYAAAAASAAAAAADVDVEMQAPRDNVQRHIPVFGDVPDFVLNVNLESDGAHSDTENPAQDPAQNPALNPAQNPVQNPDQNFPHCPNPRRIVQKLYSELI